MSIKQRIKNWVIKDLYCSPIAQDIVTVRQVGTTGMGEPIYRLFMGGEQMADAEIKSLQSDVKILEGMKIWHILTNNLTDKAKEIMFVNAKTTDDLFFGKAILYSMDLMSNINKEIKKIKL